MIATSRSGRRRTTRSPATGERRCGPTGTRWCRAFAAGVVQCRLRSRAGRGHGAGPRSRLSRAVAHPAPLGRLLRRPGPGGFRTGGSWRGPGRRADGSAPERLRAGRRWLRGGGETRRVAPRPCPLPAGGAPAPAGTASYASWPDRGSCPADFRPERLNRASNHAASPGQSSTAGAARVRGITRPDLVPSAPEATPRMTRESPGSLARAGAFIIVVGRIRPLQRDCLASPIRGPTQPGIDFRQRMRTRSRTRCRAWWDRPAPAPPRTFPQGRTQAAPTLARESGLRASADVPTRLRPPRAPARPAWPGRRIASPGPRTPSCR